MSCPVESKYRTRTCVTWARRGAQRGRGPGYTRKPRDAGGEGQITPVAAQAGPQHWHFAWFAWFAWPLLIARAWPRLGAPSEPVLRACLGLWVGCSQRGAGPSTFTDLPLWSFALGWPWLPAAAAASCS